MRIAQLDNRSWKRPLDLTKGNEENEDRKCSRVRATTDALTRVIRRRASKIPTSFLFVSFVASCEVNRCFQVEGNSIAQPMPPPFQTSGHSAIQPVEHHGKGIRGVRLAECLRAVTARMTLLGGGDSEWSEHAYLLDRPLHDPFITAQAGSLCV